MTKRNRTQILIFMVGIYRNYLKSFNSQTVYVAAEADDNPCACSGEHGGVSIFLSRVYIRYMYFYYRRCYSTYSICDGDGRVGVCPGVEDDAVVVKAALVQFVDNCSFVVALEIFNGVARVCFP